MVELEGSLVVNRQGIVAEGLCHLRTGQVVYVRLFVSRLSRSLLLARSRDLVLALKDVCARYPIASDDL